MKTKKIAVVMGGPSTEREISLLTGRAILAALQERGYQAFELQLQPHTFMEDLKQSGADVVFNAVHGLYGEDGRLQSVLEMMGIPYTGSGVLASAIGMDKAYTKRVFRAEQVPTADFLILHKQEAAPAVELIKSKLGIPVVVKAAAQGSSIGVEIVKSEEALAQAVEESFKYGDEILAEQFISGRESTVAMLEEKDGSITPLPVINIVPHSGAYDFQSKYTKGATDYLVPAPFSAELTAKLQSVAVAAYKALGCSGVARADAMIDADDNVYVLELNTVPGMTATSLVPKAAAAVGISFPELCEKILLAAKC